MRLDLSVALAFVILSSIPVQRQTVTLESAPQVLFAHYSGVDQVVPVLWAKPVVLVRKYNIWLSNTNKFCQ
jgi:hypothetical protein